MNRSFVMPALAGALVLAGCASSGPHTREGGAVTPLAVTAVDWNPGHADVGRVRAVADTGDVVAVLGPDGATIFASRAPFASDKSVTTWKEAVTLPGPDGAPQIFAIAENGRLYALRGRTTFDDVSDRFGLGQKHVKSAAALSAKSALFAGEGEIATADGASVLLFGTPSLTSVHGAGVTGVGIDGARVYVFDLDRKTSRSYPLSGVTHAVVAPGGAVVATTKRAVYMQDDQGALALVYDAGGETIHGLTVSGDRVWFADKGELGVVSKDHVAETTDAKIAEDAELAPSSNGDVWVIGGGKLARFSPASATGPLTASGPSAPTPNATAPHPAPSDPTWDRLSPVFARACASCHLPNGPAGVDLSSSAGWTREHDKIKERVLEKKSMPPPGHALSDADREIIRQWAESPPR